MFSISKWTPPDGVAVTYNYRDTKFKYLIEHQNANVKKSFEVTKESDFWKSQRDVAAITGEMARQKRELDADYGLRKKLHQSDEMQAIKKHLRNAYVKRYVTEQPTAYDRKLQRIEEARVEGRKRADWYKIVDSQVNQENNSKSCYKKRELREGLLKQLEEHRQKMAAEKQSLQDEQDYQNAQKKMREEEDRVNRLRKLEIATQVKNDMNFLLEYRAKLRRIANADVDYYSERSFKYAKLLEEQKRLNLEEKKNLIKKKQQIADMIGFETYLLEQNKLRDENRLIELWISEYNRKVDDKTKEKFLLKLADRANLMGELEKEGIDRIAYYREKMKRKREVDAKQRREQDEAEAKAKKEKDELDHWRSQAQGYALRMAMEDHRLNVIQDRTHNIKYHKALKKHENDRQKIIQEERCKLMQAAEPEILRYLRNGVVNAKDLEYLRGEHHKIVAEILYRKGLSRSQYLISKSQ